MGIAVSPFGVPRFPGAADMEAFFSWTCSKACPRPWKPFSDGSVWEKKVLKYHRKRCFFEISASARNGEKTPRFLDKRPVFSSWASALGSSFHPGIGTNGHKWPRGSSWACLGVPLCLCPGTTIGTGTLLPRRRKIRSAGRKLNLGACVSAVATLVCPQVSRWHREAHFGYWRPGAPWSAPGGM